MKNKTYILVAMAILGVGGYFIYKEYKKPKELTKELSVDIIIKAGKHKNKETLLTFEEGYLKAWANAIQLKNTKFLYNDKIYNTQGGKSVK